MPIMQNRDKKVVTLPTEYMQRQIALVEQARAEYRQRQLAQQPEESKLVTTEYMQRQLTLIELARKKHAEDRNREVVEQNLDQGPTRLGNKR